jgi:hypothetical protein
MCEKLQGLGILESVERYSKHFMIYDSAMLCSVYLNSGVVNISYVVLQVPH